MSTTMHVYPSDEYKLILLAEQAGFLIGVRLDWTDLICTITVLCQLIALTNIPMTHVHRIIEHYGLHVRSVGCVHDSTYYIFEDMTKLVIVFQNNTLHWLGHATRWATTECHIGLVHAYLQQQVSAVWPIIDIPNQDGCNILVTGHGTAGAIALLYASRLKKRHKDRNIGVYSFGAPRVGNTEWVNAISNLPHWRIVNYADDHIPNLPVAKTGFIHHGKMLLIGANCKIQQPGSCGTDLMNTVRNYIAWYRLGVRVDNEHRIYRYATKLLNTFITHWRETLKTTFSRLSLEYTRSFRMPISKRLRL